MTALVPIALLALLAQAVPGTGAATSRLVESGVMGAVAVLEGAAILLLWRDTRAEQRAHAAALQAISEARLTQEHDCQARILQLATQCAQGLAASTAASEALRLALAESRQAIRDLDDEIREISEKTQEIALRSGNNGARR